jgi:hypothetical protein
MVDMPVIEMSISFAHISMHCPAYSLTVRSSLSAIARSLLHRPGRKSDRRFSAGCNAAGWAMDPAQNVFFCAPAATGQDVLIVVPRGPRWAGPASVSAGLRERRRLPLAVATLRRAGSLGRVPGSRLGLIQRIGNVLQLVSCVTSGEIGEHERACPCGVGGGDIVQPAGLDPSLAQRGPSRFAAAGGGGWAGGQDGPGPCPIQVQGHRLRRWPCRVLRSLRRRRRPGCWADASPGAVPVAARRVSRVCLPNAAPSRKDQA